MSCSTHASVKNISTVVVLCSWRKLSWRAISSDTRVFFSWEIDNSCSLIPWKTACSVRSLSLTVNQIQRMCNRIRNACGHSRPQCPLFLNAQKRGQWKIHYDIVKTWLDNIACLLFHWKRNVWKQCWSLLNALKMRRKDWTYFVSFPNESYASPPLPSPPPFHFKSTSSRLLQPSSNTGVSLLDENVFLSETLQ